MLPARTKRLSSNESYCGTGRLLGLTRASCVKSTRTGPTVMLLGTGGKRGKEAGKDAATSTEIVTKHDKPVKQKFHVVRKYV